MIYHRCGSDATNLELPAVFSQLLTEKFAAFCVTHSGVPSNAYPPSSAIPPAPVPRHTPHDSAHSMHPQNTHVGASGGSQTTTPHPQTGRHRAPSTHHHHVPPRATEEHGVSREELPPHVSAGLAGVDESLAAMLMSWYQSGFHTGYYLAQQELTARDLPTYDEKRHYGPRPDTHRPTYVPQPAYGHEEHVRYAPRHPQAHVPPPPHAHYPPLGSYYHDGGYNY